MASSSVTREQADAKFEKTQKAAREAAKAAAEYEADARALRARTVKLRELRLAKEAADELEAAAKKPAPKKAKAAATRKRDAATA